MDRDRKPQDEKKKARRRKDDRDAHRDEKIVKRYRDGRKTDRKGKKLWHVSYRTS